MTLYHQMQVLTIRWVQRSENHQTTRHVCTSPAKGGDYLRRTQIFHPDPPAQEILAAQLSGMLSADNWRELPGQPHAWVALLGVLRPMAECGEGT